MTEFFILSLKWTRTKNRKLGIRQDDPYVTFWGRDNAGYRWAVCEFGRYTEEQVRAESDYYDNGTDTLAVPCDVVIAMTSEGSTEVMDKRADMRVVLHTPANMEKLRANALRTSRMRVAA